MKKNVTIFLCILICFCLLLGACAAAPQSAPADMAPQATREAAAQEEIAVDTEDITAEEAGTGDLGTLSNAALPDTNRKLTYSATFDISTKQYDSDYNKINTEIGAVGGYIEHESSGTNAPYNTQTPARYTTMTMRIPVDNYNAFLDKLSGIGEVTNKQKNTEDFSDQYYDTTSRIDLLEGQKARLMEHLATATNTEDIIALEQEITDVIYELDQLQGNVRRMDNLVEYATVSMNLTELITPETIGSDGQPLGDRASEAFSLSMTGVGRFLENFAIGFMAALPVIILIVIIIVIVLIVIRLVRVLMKKYRVKHPKKITPPPYYGQPYQQQQPYAPQYRQPEETNAQEQTDDQNTDQ
ncbi:MAG: DUF4349 domain-containing protein [Christensenella sp.]|uniref:DUF4349 domain-containing protein n=1 Tax=Christensenella sp. TaxID=1935934 RepID=UPI002B202B88|nr:DUF4349 domain-containing protein [Christensenella sp.]MEA5002655.1 DUF4349 domain-containing protein [Christensenella sp.]